VIEGAGAKVLNVEWGNEVVSLNNLGAMYRFSEEGYYSMSLEIEDTNGNVKSIGKSRIIRVLDPVKFRIFSNINQIK
jgi:hypothetical protein